MAYKVACIPIAHQVGREFGAARTKKAAQLASARFYRSMGLGFKAKQLEQQAEKEFQATKKALLDRMEINGCL